MLADQKPCQTAFPAFDMFALFVLNMAGCGNEGSLLNNSHFKHGNKPSFYFLQISIQEPEGEIGKEGERLDLGEEGEEETTGTVGTGLCNNI